MTKGRVVMARSRGVEMGKPEGRGVTFWKVSDLGSETTVVVFYCCSKGKMNE
jgi:hypothetical protein